MATSDRAAAVRRYLGSRKNLAGMTGALAGTALHLVGVLGDVWPAVAVGLYAVGALVGPAEPVPPAPPVPLTDLLRAEAATLRAGVVPRARELPSGTVAAIAEILDVLRLVLDRLDQVADQPVDRNAAPERLATAAEIIRVDLPACLDAYLGRAPSASEERAAAELAVQLDLVAGSAARLVEAVPDVDAQRAEELTRELRRRHGGS